MRKFFLFAGVLIIAAALAIVPMPFFELEPGGALPVQPRIELSGADGADEIADEVNGELLLTTVRLETPSALEAVGTLFDDEEDLVARRTVVPAGLDADEYRRQQQRIFEESGTIAAAVAQRAAGMDVTISGDGARVDRVLEGSPAAGELESGDVIVEIDGKRVQLAGDVGVALTDADAGDEVTLVVERDDDRMTVEIELQEIGQLGQPGIGVALRTVNREIDMPVDVELLEEEIGGPSAGLILALTIYELIADEDVVAGRTIAGTGTIDTTGAVGRVRGVAQKVRAAEDADADVFLVPAADADDARDIAGPDIEIIAVESFEEALDALRSP